MIKELSLYLHIPYCLSKCTYCDFFSISCGKDFVPQAYVDSLCKEIEFRLNAYVQLHKDFVIKTIYIGGGTPSLLSAQQLSEITSTIFKFTVSDNLEFTIEVNPDDVTIELLQTLEQNKITRISCGVQSFSDTVLKSVHRRADLSQILSAFDIICSNWKGIFSIDLICGLPGETKESLLHGLQLLCSRQINGQKIHHISFYSLCVEEETPLGKDICSNRINFDQDECDNLWLAGRNFLLENGYKQYEVSNFCLENFECVHNMTYWKHQDYIGCGAGATGTIYFNDGTGKRTTTTRDLNLYIQPWTNEPPSETENLTAQTSEFEYFMMGLRTCHGVSEKDYETIFGKAMPLKYISLFTELEKQGKCKITQDENSEKLNFSLTQNGLLFLNQILLSF